MTDQRSSARPRPVDSPKAAMTRIPTGTLVLIELGGILAVLGPVVNGIVIVAVLPPLVLFLTTRHRRDDVTDAAREALNFQITAVSVMLVLQVLGFVLPSVFVAYGQGSTALTAYVTALALVGIVALADLLLSLYAIVRIGSGRDFRFPVAFRPIK
jgi:uncharacterized Tic20 family protein